MEIKMLLSPVTKGVGAENWKMDSLGENSKSVKTVAKAAIKERGCWQVLFPCLR